ncbi:MAG: hypothetical protein MH472_05670 [Bacteroidia bacterium]|nr:hypothetical protein [Bacteroidia bacterium]
MKNLILAAMLFSGISVFGAQTETREFVGLPQDTTAKTQPVVASETAIKLEELPEKVKAAIAAPAMAEWKANSAFLVKTGDKLHYKIELMKGAEKKIVNLNAEGAAL